MIFRKVLLSSLSFNKIFAYSNAESLRSLSRLPARIKLKDEDIKENFLKGSGPGGQKINKTASAVQLSHGPTGVVIKCQATRSRSQNRDIARRLLADRVEELEKGAESRVAIKAEVKRKKKASKTKKARRKYRKSQESNEESASSESVEAERALRETDTT